MNDDKLPLEFMNANAFMHTTQLDAECLDIVLDNRAILEKEILERRVLLFKNPDFPSREKTASEFERAGFTNPFWEIVMDNDNPVPFGLVVTLDKYIDQRCSLEGAILYNKKEYLKTFNELKAFMAKK